MVLNRLILIYLLFFCAQLSIAQNTTDSEPGSSIIKNVSPKIYAASGQNWAAVQDSAGLLYFANSGGLILQYDGVRWESIPVGNGSIVRDIQRDRSGALFVGMQNDFGYLKKDRNGTFVYHSLVHMKDGIQNKFGDIWKIGVGEQDVFFLERHHLFRVPKNSLTDSSISIKPIKAKTRFHNIFRAGGNRFFVHQVDVGLMKTDRDSLKLILNGDFFKKDLLAAVLPDSKQNWLVVTRNRGLFIYSENGQIRPFKTSSDNLLRNSGLYQAIRLSDGTLAIASKYGGLFILSANGALLQKIDTNMGLADNTVWSVFEDSKRGLWLSLNKGIAYIDYASPFTLYNERNGLKGSVHDIIRFKQRIYVTTNYGLFVSTINSSGNGQTKFEPVHGITTSGWDLLSVKNTLFIIANSGLFKLRDRQARLLFKYDPWVLYQSKADPARIYIGLASGVVSFYMKNDGQLKDEGKIPGIGIEARTLAEDERGDLWVASSYNGVLKADSVCRYFSKSSQPKITHYNTKYGLPSNVSTLLFEIGTHIRFATSEGIYLFDRTAGRFLADPAFEELNRKKRHDETYMLVREDARGIIWSHIGQRIVKNIPTDAGNYSLSDTMFWGIPEEEIQVIYPDGKRFVWFGHRNGIYKYDAAKKQMNNMNFKPLIREVLLNGHTRLPGNLSVTYFEKIPEINYTSYNMLRFKYAAPFFIKPEQTVYRHQLIGFDRSWSSWSPEAQKDYTNLPHGKYTFKVQARNIFNQIREAETYSIIILAPWYQTVWAYLIYILLISGLAVTLFRLLMHHSQTKALAEHRRKEEQRRQTEDSIRSQVAADFHDELGTRITRISLFSEILKNDLGNAGDSAQSYLQKISKNADRLYDETRDFIWQLDPQKDSLLDFISRLKSFGDELFEDTDIQFELKNAIDNSEHIKLEMDQRRNLIRIIKETLHNALKYAQCKNVIIEIFKQDRLLSFIVQDDGVGFSPESKSDGTGLQNMRIRAQKIKADFKLQSERNTGTRIKVSIDI